MGEEDYNEIPPEELRVTIVRNDFIPTTPMHSIYSSVPVDADALHDSEAEVATEWTVGDVILDLYQVTDLLGEGGMGKVYKVHHRGWKVDLAVKIPRLEIFVKQGVKENFIREAETWVNLGLHPHIVSCYYVRMLGNIPCIFSEYVESGSLSDWIYTHKLYEGGEEEALARILDIAIQFAWGLNYAHEQGLVHQDVKPANVMMTKDGIAKVTDFGLTRARKMAGVAKDKTTNRSILVSTGGMTPEYCSPEQAQGKKLTQKADIWSWGLSLLEIFTSKVTWKTGQVAPRALKNYLEEKREDNSFPEMPGEVAGLLKKCFNPNPEDRPKDMLEIVEVLKQAYQKVAGKPYSRLEPQAAELLADGLNNRALSYLDLGKEKQAEKAWKASLNADRLHTETIYNQGIYQMRRSKSTDVELIHKLQEAIKASSGENWNGKYLLALVYLERWNVDSAIPLLEEAAQQAPEEMEVQNALDLARSGEITETRLLRSFEGHKNSVWSASLSTDGRFALSGSDDNTLRLWEIKTGKCLRILEGHTGSVQSVCLSQEGNFAISVSMDKSIIFWKDIFKHRPNELVVQNDLVNTSDILELHELKVFEGHKDTVSSVSLSADGCFALSGSLDKTLRLWKVATGKCLRVFEGHKLLVYSVCLSRDGRFALSGSLDKTLRLWEIATGKCLRVFEGHTNSVNSVYLSADGLFALSGSGEIGSQDNTVRLWEVATGKCLRIFEGHQDAVNTVYLSPDSRFAISGSDDETLRLWEVSTGKCLRVLEGHTGPVYSVFLSANCRFVLSGSSDKSIRLWQIPQQISNICNPRLSKLWSHEELLKLDIQAQLLLKKSDENLKKGEFTEALAHLRKARELPGYERKPHIMDSWAKLYLLCTKITLRNVWASRVFKEHKSFVYSVYLSEDGSYALSGSDDKTLRL